MSFSAEEVSRYPEIFFTKEQLEAIIERLKFLYWHPTASCETQGIQHSTPLYRKVGFSPVGFQPVLYHNPEGGEKVSKYDYDPPTKKILYQGTQRQEVLYQEVLYQHTQPST